MHYTSRRHTSASRSESGITIMIGSSGSGSSTTSGTASTGTIVPEAQDTPRPLPREPPTPRVRSHGRLHFRHAYHHGRSAAAASVRRRLRYVVVQCVRRKVPLHRDVHAIRCFYVPTLSLRVEEMGGKKARRRRRRWLRLG